MLRKNNAFASRRNFPYHKISQKMTNKIKNISIIVLITMITFCKTATITTAQTTTNYTKYVNPFIGTAPFTDPKLIGYTPPKGWRVWAGLTYPGSSLPNAMVQLSPITEYHTGAGYQYEDTVIYGFTHTNKGHWNLCNIPILPVSNSGNSGNKFGSHFSHKTESAAPAFYKVFLDDYNVEVSLTSTLRCGYHQYNYKDNKNRQILFDLSKANNRVVGWNIEQVGNTAVQGYQDIRESKIYFYASLNNNIKRLEKRGENSRDGMAIVHLNDDGNGPIELKIGLSYVSCGMISMKKGRYKACFITMRGK